MRLDERRESGNVEDRRGRSGGGGKASLGVGGLIIAGLLVWFMGGNPLEVLQQAGGLDMMQGGTQTEYVPSAQEEALATFSKQVFASTEEVWEEIFTKNGVTYKKPQLVLYTRATTSRCGSASASTGPFYCSADQSIYIDLSFLDLLI